MSTPRVLALALICLLAPACSDSENPPEQRPDAGMDIGADSPTEDVGGEDTDDDTAPDAADQGPDLEGPEVTISQGTLVGVEADGARSFKGIPYAAPPIGDLRWRPPAEAASWDGPRDATAFGPPCPSRDLLAPSSPPGGSEDCLTLNVWTPAPEPAAPLPVMVWIHGGAWIAGTASQAHTDGTQLVRNGVVFVSLNYRLDTLGFLAHPALSDENEGTSGNWGLQDQQAALRWVRDNIAAFGGDPARVTVFGESAGGHAVCTHMVASQDLIAGAISQSGICSLRLDNLQTAHGHGEALARQFDCGEADDVLACLREVPAEEIVVVTDPKSIPGSLLTHPLPFKPIVDGVVLAEQPAAAIAAGNFANVPFLSGTTADEANLFHVSLLHTAVADESQYLAALQSRFGDDAEAIVAQYPAGDDADAALNLASTHGLFACPARRTARAAAGHPSGDPGTWLYVFDAEPAGVAVPGLGAFHGGELPFLFGTDHGAFGEVGDEQKPISEAMQRYWTRFAITGDPNGGDDPGWPAYGAESDEHLRIADPSVAEADYLSDACDFWDSLE